MRRVTASRAELVGVLVRPPCSSSELAGWARLVVNPVEQIEELADLQRRGLLTPEEFEYQKTKIIGG
jgi:hypothetical protein